MAVGLFTLHAYGTWWPDNRRGYTVRGKGVLAPDSEAASRYRERARGDEVRFDLLMQRVLIAGAVDVCQHRGWRLHGVGTDPTHGHFLLSCAGYLDFTAARDRLKNLLSLFLGRASAIEGRKWFAAGGSKKRVEDRERFDYLMSAYLPKQRGLFWREGMELPEIPEGILHPPGPASHG
jgi:hypothetical protein